MGRISSVTTLGRAEHVIGCYCHRVARPEVSSAVKICQLCGSRLFPKDFILVCKQEAEWLGLTRWKSAHAHKIKCRWEPFSSISNAYGVHSCEQVGFRWYPLRQSSAAIMGPCKSQSSHLHPLAHWDSLWGTGLSMLQKLRGKLLTL